MESTGLQLFKLNKCTLDSEVCNLSYNFCYTVHICFIIVVLLQLMQGWWYSQVSYCAVCQQKLVTYSVPVLGSCSRHMLSVIVWCENKFTAHISKMISWMNSLAQCYFFWHLRANYISYCSLLLGCKQTSLYITSSLSLLLLHLPHVVVCVFKCLTAVRSVGLPRYNSQTRSQENLVLQQGLDLPTPPMFSEEPLEPTTSPSSPGRARSCSRCRPHLQSACKHCWPG